MSPKPAPTPRSERVDRSRLCPDKGTCHHDCTMHCWRALNCGPLSNIFPGDRWPVSTWLLSGFGLYVPLVRAMRWMVGSRRG